ncbi:MAG: ammonia-forming cytochrome c nitrite reductase subunit c552 [Coriobacteriales bacterium]|jgi:nitrite reductase (cytochrome c-552)|nr:ammonia-forming cytochrome c nitrite reductase subunit c552 [Coriobacteriales bacterium]
MKERCKANKMLGTGSKRKLRNWIVVVGICAAVVALAACAPSETGSGGTGTGGTGSTSTSTVKEKPATPAANAAGVVTAEAWKDAYPHQYASYIANEDNSTEGGGVFAARGDMIEMYPQITTIWKGNPFSKSYFEPNGHQYAITDIAASGRPNEKTLANCLTCKSADFTAMYQKQGDAIFAQPFADVLAQLDEPISCYNCHENDPESLAVTQAFFADALGSDGGASSTKVPMSAQVCGQCHNEYYFNGETKAVTNPYSGVAQATPEAIYKYYTDKGFSDATHPDSSVGWIKVQHPEFEFVYGGTGSSMAKRMNPATGENWSCADCHMGEAQTASDGTKYRSHLLVSPLENEELLESSCNLAGCHIDLAKQVKAWQEESEGKVQAVGDKLVELTNKIAQKVAAGEDVAEVSALDREAQFYWEFVMVENSEGAHNPTLSNSCLDRAARLADQALGLLA